MMRNLFFILVCLSVVVSPVFSQTKNNTVSQLPEIEPFKLSRGSSFSASTTRIPNQKMLADSEKIGSDVISEDFSDALKIISDNYINGKQIDYNELTKSSITSMLRTLDPHSNYFDSAEYQDLLTDQQSEYFGIGATIVNYKKNGVYDTYVTSCFSRFPGISRRFKIRRQVCFRERRKCFRQKFGICARQSARKKGNNRAFDD